MVNRKHHHLLRFHSRLIFYAFELLENNFCSIENDFIIYHIFAFFIISFILMFMTSYQIKILL